MVTRQISISEQHKNLISIPAGRESEPRVFPVSYKPHTRAGESTDLSSDGPAQETMADSQAAPPSESTDHKPEAEPAAGEDATPQSNTEEGRKIIRQELRYVSGVDDFTVCQELKQN